MKFEYSLNGVLNYRKTVEDLKKHELNHAKKEVKLQEDKLREMKSEYSNLLEEIISKGSFDVLEQKQYYRYLENVKEKLEMQRGRVESCNQLCDSVRASVIDAQKDRKIMEKLEQKEWKKFLLEMKREEDKEFNEMAGILFYRKEV
ncbi:MAG: flagellar export protein FliJ [Peptostreptococcales bacterium]